MVGGDERIHGSLSEARALEQAFSDNVSLMADVHWGHPVRRSRR